MKFLYFIKKYLKNILAEVFLFCLSVLVILYTDFKQMSESGLVSCPNTPCEFQINNNSCHVKILSDEFAEIYKIDCKFRFNISINVTLSCESYNVLWIAPELSPVTCTKIDDKNIPKNKKKAVKCDKKYASFITGIFILNSAFLMFSYENIKLVDIGGIQHWQ